MGPTKAKITKETDKLKNKKKGSKQKINNEDSRVELENLLGESIRNNGITNKHLIDNLVQELDQEKNSNFEDFKRLADKRSAVSNNIINILLSKIDGPIDEQTMETIEDDSVKDKVQIQRLAKENAELKKKLAEFEDISRDSINQSMNQSVNQLINNEKLIEKFEIVADIIENACGIRINQVDDSDEDNLVFVCRQVGSKGEIKYKLILSRQQESLVEIIYSPILGNDKQELEKVLPEYFFETLTFPVETLPQFYQKLSRGLNKLGLKEIDEKLNAIAKGVKDDLMDMVEKEETDKAAEKAEVDKRMVEI